MFPGWRSRRFCKRASIRSACWCPEKAIDQTALAVSTRFLRPPFGAISWWRRCRPWGTRGPGRLITSRLRLAKATRGCVAAFDEFKPDVVLGMGGFTSAPAVFGARWFRKRGTATLIHESNAVPGKANRWAGRLADHVAVGLADCARYFGHKPVTVTGTPIREALRRGKVADAHAQLGLETGRMTVLVAGGSQGARAINESIALALATA